MRTRRAGGHAIAGMIGASERASELFVPVVVWTSASLYDIDAKLLNVGKRSSEHFVARGAKWRNQQINNHRT